MVVAFVETRLLVVIRTVGGYKWRVPLFVDFLIHQRPHLSRFNIRLVYHLNSEILFDLWNLISVGVQEVEGNIEPDGVLFISWKRLVDVCLAEKILPETITKRGVFVSEQTVTQRVAVSYYDDADDHWDEATRIGLEFVFVFDFESDSLAELVKPQNQIRYFAKNNHLNN